MYAKMSKMLQLSGNIQNIESGVSNFFKMSVFVGFLVTTTLIVGLNFKIFKFVFKDSIQKYWWAFMLASLIPLFLLLYFFTLLFGGTFEFLSFR